MADSDGWSSTWTVETYWTCTYDTLQYKSICSDKCGDGRTITTMPSTYWDDGNTNNGDGCSSTCAVENKWECSGGTTTLSDSCFDKWGDGFVVQTITNYWDDGNTISGDGCSSSCTKEIYWSWTSGTSTTSSVCNDICGDGKIMNSPHSNYCDDGNSISGEGCDSTWNVETKWTCSGGSSSGRDVCIDDWGDGYSVQPTTGYWDDGDANPGDGCNASWAVETGWECTLGDALTQSICTEIWGDGIVIIPTFGYCDDNNLIDGDGCDSNWAVETGWTCTLGGSVLASTCTEICGDGMVFYPNVTYWDDNNLDDYDGCSSSCTIETGWEWTQGSILEASECQDLWGDGFVMDSKTDPYWDDGNILGGDGCSDSCKEETGWVWLGGNQTDQTICNACQPLYCTLWQNSDHTKCETCDDGYSLTGVFECEKEPKGFNFGTLSQIILGAGATFASLNAIITLSSPAALWAMANQLQLLLLLALTKSSLPDDVINFITGNNFASFSFNFLPIQSLPLFGSPSKWNEDEQKNANLSKIGVENFSSFTNNYSFLLWLWLTFALQIFVTTLEKWKPKQRENKLIRAYLFFIKYLFQFLTFTVYIRMIMEGYQYLLLSSVSEIYYVQDSTVFSYLFALLIAAFCIAFVIITSYATAYYDYDPEKFSKTQELYAGLKPIKTVRIYSVFILLRRLVLVSWLIGMSSYNKYPIILFAMIVQFSYLLFMFYLRPFEKLEDNIVELTNEVFFTFLLTALSHLNTEEKWTKRATDNYLYVLMGNNIVIAAILLSKRVSNPYSRFNRTHCYKMQA